MKPLPVGRSIIAIDIRLSRFGYAVFQGQQHLLDWGGRTCSVKGKDNLAAARFAELAKVFEPILVVLKQERRGGIRNSNALTVNANAIKFEAAARSIPCIALSPEQVKAAFGAFSIRTKDDIAAVLAGIFPELLWELPRKRKRWHNEHPRIAMFDAVAIGFAYFKLCTSPSEST
jgi:hypothetical protein